MRDQNFDPLGLADCTETPSASPVRRLMVFFDRDILANARCAEPEFSACMGVDWQSDIYPADAGVDPANANNKMARADVLTDRQNYCTVFAHDKFP